MSKTNTRSKNVSKLAPHHRKETRFPCGEIFNKFILKKFIDFNIPKILEILKLHLGLRAVFQQ